MKLDLRRKFSTNEYRCELTRELDSLAQLIDKDSYELFYHYIVADNWCKKENILAIRVPGGTVGGIYIDDDNVITKIIIDTDYVVKTYPSDVNELIQKFVGEVIEY